jgi:hypothetical protein
MPSNNPNIKIDDSSSEHGEVSKQPYEKPQIDVIYLTAAEILSAGCKVSGSSGPAGICASSCSNNGS